MVNFDDEFRRHAWPRLVLRARGLAVLIEAGYCGFADASDMLMQEALRLGGALVSDFYDLEEALSGLLADLTEERLNTGETNERR